MAWLMRHELRLYLRSGVLKATSLTFLIIVEVLLHLIAGAVAFGVRSMDRSAAAAFPDALPALLATAGLAFCFLFMLSRGLNGIVQVLYTRGDLDLLLSSPLAPKSIIGVRVFTVALTVTLEVGMLAWPFANMFVVFGSPAWARLYVLLPAIGMLATAVAIVLALTLFRLLGPRTTRLIGQVLAALIGMGIFLLSQLPNLLRNGPGRPGHYNAFGALLSGNGAGHFGAVLIPGRWLLAGPGPTVLLALSGTAALLLAVQVLSNRFLRAATAIGSMGSVRVRRRSTRSLGFRGSLRTVLIRKELRLIRRDPLLLMQLLQQSIYLVPVSFLMWRQSASHPAGIPWFWLALIFVCGTLATSLAWVTVAAEDAPELLTAAPPGRATVVRAKIEAALLPLMPLWVLPLLIVARSQPWFAVSLSLCACGCSVSTALLQIYRPPGRRDAFKTRARGSPGQSFIELAVVLAWLLVCAAMTWVGVLLRR